MERERSSRTGKKGMGGRERELCEKVEDILLWLTRTLGSDARCRVGVGRRDEEADVVVEEDNRSDSIGIPSGAEDGLVTAGMDFIIETGGSASLFASLSTFTDVVSA